VSRPGREITDMSKTDKPAPRAGRTAVPWARWKRWNEQRRQIFLIRLSETANVTKAARKAEMSLSSAYHLKHRDRAFARAWREALEVGFCELEMSLLRGAIEGVEQVETMEVGPERELKYVKTTKKPAHAIGMRLLDAHRGEVDEFRRERGGGAAHDGDVAARVRAHMDAVRERLAARDPEAGERNSEARDDAG
jgi:hypothetical protein